ncbi:MAG: hypothetical protein K0R14_476 [Burkholderiales bacterium]|jgi:hypothetical protein|nr:hypothetical protein [Burkholderiales bacterium]
MAKSVIKSGYIMINPGLSIIKLKLIWVICLLFCTFTLSGCGGGTNSAPASSFNFSIAQIPDTQSYFSHSWFPQDTAYYSSPPPYSHPMQIFDMYKWVIDHNAGKNFLYIAQVGDIIEMGGQCTPSGALLPNQPPPVCTTDENDPPDTPHSDPVQYTMHSETYVEWHAVDSVFSKIEEYMKSKETLIPFGFAVGNHDPRSYSVIQDDFYGHGYMSPNTTVSVRAFLKKRYNNGHNPHQYIDINKEYGDSYLLSFYNLPLDKTGVPLTILNLPIHFNLAGMSNLISTFITDAKKSHRLIILNTHICEEAYPLLDNENILMVLCGHDPNKVYTNGSYDKTEKIIVSNKPVYRFDYQAGLISNLPQQPLVRYYDFTFDPRYLTLSWQANDVRAWQAGEKFDTLGLDPDGFYDNKPFSYEPGLHGWDPTVKFKEESVPIGLRENISLKY